MEFSDFWQLYPRRVAKKEAERAWAKLSDEQRAQALAAVPQHIKLWKAEGRGIQFMPYPATYLNQERFTDEFQMPEQQVVENWRDVNFVMARGRELGIPARPGEDLPEYANRLRRAA